MTDKINRLLDEMGITSGEWEIDHEPRSKAPYLLANRFDVICEFNNHPRIREKNKGPNARLIKQARNILMTMIDFMIWYEDAIDDDDRLTPAHKVIESAIPKDWTWKRIRKRLEEIRRGCVDFRRLVCPIGIGESMTINQKINALLDDAGIYGGEWKYKTTPGSNHEYCTVYQPGGLAVGRHMLPPNARLVTQSRGMLHGYIEDALDFIHLISCHEEMKRPPHNIQDVKDKLKRNIAIIEAALGPWPEIRAELEAM
jgi:hypothetical protein